MPTIDEQRFDALLEEYKTLRREIEQATQLRVAILAFGATTWAGLAAWLIAHSTLIYSEPALLLLHVPLVTIFLLVMVAERNIIRISSYIREFLEPEIKGLRWETRVAEFQHRSKFILSTSQIASMIFFLMSFSAVCLVNLFGLKPILVHRPWIDFLVFAPFWSWLLFRHFPQVLTLGTRISEQSATQLWKAIGSDEWVLGPANLRLDPHDIFVGMPAFNMAGSIENAVSSVVEEVKLFTVNSNIVVYDDASTDDTRRRAADIVGRLPRVALAYSNRQRGKSATMNALAAYSKSAGARLLFFLDPDITCKSKSIKQLLSCLESSAPGCIVAPTVLPQTEALRFPMRQVYEFKLKTEVFRKKYRAYLNGRAFAVRSSDFPELPENLGECDDRYLTIMFSKPRIISCNDSVFYYQPPQTICALFWDRVKAQERLIQLSRYHPTIYNQLWLKRWSLFHSYFFSYPKEVRKTIVGTIDPLTWIALVIERVVVVVAKITAEVVKFFIRARTSRA